jgi:hypothetical protein
MLVAIAIVLAIVLGPLWVWNQILPRCLSGGLPADILVAGAAWGPTLAATRVVTLLVAVGDASYSLYLIHPFVIRPRRNIWIAAGGGMLPLGFYVVMCALVAIVGALLIYRFLERPLTVQLQRRKRSSAGAKLMPCATHSYAIALTEAHPQLGLDRPVDETRAAMEFSEHSATHRQRRQPHQADQTQPAEYRRRAEILDPADIGVLLARDMVGELLDGRVQKFDGEHDQDRADHGDIPRGARRDRDADDEPHRQQPRLLAYGGLGSHAVDKPAQRIGGRAVKPLQGRSDE